MKSMIGNTCFLDSNLWLYLLGSDTVEGEAEKKAVVKNLVQNNLVLVSTQVVNEVCKNLRFKYGMTEDEIPIVINHFFSRFTVLAFDDDFLNLGHLLRKKYSKELGAGHRSYWDSLIVAAAFYGGASVLFSEDGQHERVYELDGILVKCFNPFK